MPVTVHSPSVQTVDAVDLERWRVVPVAVAVDVSLGECQIDPAIRPLRPAGLQPQLFGRAVTVRVGAPDFGAVLVALDVIAPGDVLVIDAAGDAVTAMLGEILGGQLRRLGAVGVVCDGAIRDVGTLAGWSDFSVFSRFVSPRGPASVHSGEVNGPVRIGGLTVSAGDLVLGDDDGLAALTPDRMRLHIVAAEAKLALEERWQASLTSGKSVRETFGL